MKFYILIFALGFLTSCSSLKAPMQKKKTHFKKIWVRSALNSPYFGPQLNHRFQPVLFENLVIQGNAADGVKAFKKSNGKKIWSFKLNDGVEAGAALFNDNLLFAAGDGFLYSVNAKTGKEKWSFPLRSPGVSRPNVSHGIVYISTGNNIVYALNAESGQRVWVYQRPEISNLSIRGASEPLVVGSTVFVGFNDGYFVALNKGTGTLKWQTKISHHRKFKDIDAKSVYSDGVVYTASFSDGVYALDAKTGAVKWSIDQGGYSNLLVLGQHLYVSTTSNEVLSMEKTTGVINWSKKLNHGYLTAPQFYKGQLLVGTSQGRLYALNALNGDVTDVFSPGRGVTSAVSVDKKDGTIFFISKAANLYAIKLERE